MSERVYRMDRNDINTRFIRTDEGLTGTAIVTNIGVFSYRQPDGSIQREARLPEDVFAPASIASLIGKPLINEHPKNGKLLDLADKAHLDAISIGRTGDLPIHTELYLGVDLKVTREDGIKAVQAGKTALSSGYHCDTIDEPGVFLGMPYDKRQVNIFYNHVALVPTARAGDAARIRLDGMPIEGDETIPGRNAMAEPILKTVKLDSGVEYQAEAPVLEALHGAQTRLDAATQELSSVKAEVSKIQAERDSLKERVDSADKELLLLKSTHVDASKLADMVRNRVELETYARASKVEIRADQSDLDVMTAIVKAKSPEAKLDGKDAVYIQARFDLLKETSRLDSADDSAARLAAGDQKVTRADGAESPAATARQKYLERLRTAHVSTGEK